MRPKIVCLCGSSRFYDAWQQANYNLTMEGCIVLTIGFYPHAAKHNETVGCTAQQKIQLDVLHFRKIDLCDEVFVLNVGGYIGESTAREIEYAKSVGRSITYLEKTKQTRVGFVTEELR